MNQLRDLSARERFATELDRNFSVVASAGSGKTYAITQRILELARSRDAIDLLPRLVVVTFTHRAADEMQQRTRQRILQEHRSPAVQSAFNRAFFGTIHSFCMKILSNYGHYLGLPAPLDLVAEDDEELWEAFVQQHHSIGRSLDARVRNELFRLAPARHLMELGRTARTLLSPPAKIGACPEIDFSKVHSVPQGRAAKDTIENSKAELSDWEKRYREGWEFVRWPARSCGAKDFVARWNEAFAPLRGWIAEAALCVAAEVQRDFRDFRVERGLITYPDQVALADELLQHPVAARRLREENFRVILDEAQDTDPAQFSVLTELTRPVEAAGRWLETETLPPRPGRFCMVGDFQQSIYRDRADLNNYRAIHQALLRDNAEGEVEFSVTFRLDQEQLDFVNGTFRGILNGENGQVRFVELQPRPTVLPGQVIRIPLGSGLLPSGEKPKDYQKARIEATDLARWIKECGPEKLRADSWSDVAILCPRKLWLRTMASALRKIGIPVAMQSESDLKGDNPAYAWLAALCTIMIDPRNSYEVVGVLREVFGLSDHDLATFSETEANRFHVDVVPKITGIVSTPLRLLAETRQAMHGLPLFDAIKVLVEKTELRRKLNSLPPEDFPDLDGEIDTLLTLAAEEEAKGTSLAGLAEKLRADFLLQRDVRRTPNEGIQLITAQKAKGSEWQAVILPFLGRAVMPPSPRYPCIIRDPRTNESFVALTKDDFPDEVRSANKVAVAQEMARLLYVASTRARHTLVLALDEEIFARSNGELQGNSQLKSLLGEKLAPPPYFQTLKTDPCVCPETTQARARTADGTDAPNAATKPLTKKETEAAHDRAADFSRKFNPSGYDEETSASSRTEIDQNPNVLTINHPAIDTPATRYGRWWHELMQQMKWREPASCEGIFQEHLKSSPVPKRSATEWKMLQKALGSGKGEAARLLGSDAIVHSEVPFLWRVNEHSCVEGTIDLALIEPGSRNCLIVDWKTNRIKPEEKEDLRARYRPQMAAYWKAVDQITGASAAAAIYATAIGEFIAYEPVELEAEWKRLRASSTDVSAIAACR